ncbi:MAG: hypothetical protein AAGJ74_16070, partial [Pseudomonadota bacterium]
MTGPDRGDWTGRAGPNRSGLSSGAFRGARTSSDKAGSDGASPALRAEPAAGFLSDEAAQIPPIGPGGTPQDGVARRDLGEDRLPGREAPADTPAAQPASGAPQPPQPPQTGHAPERNAAQPGTPRRGEPDRPDRFADNGAAPDPTMRAGNAERVG